MMSSLELICRVILEESCLKPQSNTKSLVASSIILKYKKGFVLGIMLLKYLQKELEQVQNFPKITTSAKFFPVSYQVYS